MSIFTQNPFTPANDPLGNLYPNTKIGLSKSESNPYGFTPGPDGMFPHNGSGLNSAAGDWLDRINFGSSARPAPSDVGSSGRPAGWTDSNGVFFSADGTGMPTPTSAVAAKREWSNADLAKLYNMSNETAYQEALSNTSYQRALKDMKAAGLNPAALFAAGRVSGADGVGYVSGPSGDSSGGYYGATSSLSSAKAARRQYLFSNGTYNWLKVAAAGATLMATKSPGKAMMAYTAAGYLLKAFNGSYQGRK